MVAPTLNNYEYQYKDSGVLLNQANVSVPFWDVESIEGLVDFPEIAQDVLDQDGRHGSFVNAKFFKHRVIAIKGTLYASVSDPETPIQTLRTSLLPDGTDYPFYWKHPNLTQRYQLGQTASFQCDVATARRIGEAPFELSFLCGDPRAFIDLSSVSWTNNVNTSAFTNAGNTNGPLVVSVTATSTTTASLAIQSVTQTRTVTLTFPVTSGQAVTVDTDTWVVRVNGVVKPATQVITNDYPTFQPGSNTWKVVSNIGNGSIAAKSAWL
jgi:phage-related protein